MGTVFSIDIRDAGVWETAIAEVVAWLHEVDETFSTYRDDSAISRLDRGELRLDECPQVVAKVLTRCDALSAESGGYFSARPAGWLDPSGYVKGWAIEQASDILRSHGSRNHAVNGGGDVQFAGERATGEAWRIGISHPSQPGRLIAIVAVRDGAVATSGTAERGAHVFDPLTGQAATELASVTIVGERLSLVDAYATAALAMGRSCRSWLTTLRGYEAVFVDGTGARWQTPGFGSWCATP